LSKAVSPQNIVYYADTHLFDGLHVVQTREVFVKKLLRRSRTMDLIANIPTRQLERAVAPSSACAVAVPAFRGRSNAWRRCTPGDDRLRSKALELQSELSRPKPN